MTTFFSREVFLTEIYDFYFYVIYNLLSASLTFNLLYIFLFTYSIVSLYKCDKDFHNQWWLSSMDSINLRGTRTHCRQAYISSGQVYGDSTSRSCFFTSSESADPLKWVSCRICSIGVLLENTMWKFLWVFSVKSFIFSE